MTIEPRPPALGSHTDPDAPPELVPGHLDTLWFQVTGTVCNLECVHCFISCGPRNRTFDLLTLGDVERALEESVALGVREYYFTGGEPFLHPDIVTILSRALAYGPVTVLTNAMLLRPGVLAPLAEAAATSRYSLEFRVSLDGYEAATHDALRGAGSFDRTVAGLRLLLAHGFLPIVTAVQTWDPGRDGEVFDRFAALLRNVGCTRPRIKILPTLKLGAEAERTSGYAETERLTTSMLEGFDLSQLICGSARVITSRGVWVCPILLDAPEGNLSADLATAAATPFELAHGACSSCYLHGAICSNPGFGVLEAGSGHVTPAA